MKLISLFLIALTMISSCIPGTTGNLEPLPERAFSTQNIQTIVFDIDAGVVNVKPSTDGTLRLSGMAPLSQPVILINEESNQATITIQILPGSSHESVYALELPAGTNLEIRSNRANINLDSLIGEITVHSVSGDINGKKLNGNIALRSGRGNVTLLDSAGKLHVLGEHGILTMQNLHGLVSSSTIMGTIRFDGHPMEDDSINLEVDHGPIIATVAKESDVQYAVKSASGEIICLLPGATYLNRSCSGIIGNGSAQLKIRSVSGKINLSAVQ